jgi:hypothetical protein
LADGSGRDDFNNRSYRGYGNNRKHADGKKMAQQVGMVSRTANHYCRECEKEEMGFLYFS